MDCLVEDDLLEATRAGGLASEPALQAHLADCQSCTAVVAALVVSARIDGEAWGNLADTHLGRYRLDVQIGAGAMGAVYRGWDEDLCRKVAIKVLRGDVDPERLAREARAAAAIVHKNVVAIHDVGTADNTSYIVSELVEGESLRSTINRGPMPRDLVMQAATELASGVAAAHDANIVHRDLKPENLIMTREGTLKILDFGLAKVVGDALEETDSAAIRGTVGYMAPEQARAEAVDARTDIFAIGAILYELSTGRRAFPGVSYAERLAALLRDTPVDLDEENLGPLAPITSRCIARDPRERFQSARDLRWALEQIDAVPVETPPPETARGPRRVGRRNLIVGGMAAAGVGVLGYMLGSRNRESLVNAPAPRQLTFRRGRLMTARFTQDGSAAYFGAAWDGEALEAHSLRFEGGVIRGLGIEADVLAVSRTELFLSLNRRNVSGQCATGQLATMPIDGERPRMLRDGVQDADCAPDGDLALIARVGTRFEVEWPIGTVLFESAKWLSNPRISPDGKRLAFLVHPHTNDDAGTIAILARGATQISELPRNWPSIAGLAWSSDEELLVSASREAEPSALWRVPLSGKVVSVFDMPTRLRLHDLGEKGHALVSRDDWRLRAMMATRDAGDVDCSLTPASMVVDIASDGSSVVTAEFGGTEAINGVYVVETANRKRQRLGPGIPLARSPDLSKVFALRQRDAAAPQPILYSSAGGLGEPVEVTPIETLRWATWITNGSLIVLGSEPARPPRLWHLNLGVGKARPLTKEGTFGRGAVDASRSRFAFVDTQGDLGILTLDGALRRLAKGMAELVVCGWSGEHPLVRTSSTPIEISRVDSQSGQLEFAREISPPALGAKGVDALVLAASDSLYAYSYGQELAELFYVSL